MLTQLFKPAWQSSNPNKRRKGLSKLNPEITTEADALYVLASTDPEQSVRLAAIERILNITLLVRLLKNAPTSLEQDKLGQMVCKATITEENDIPGALKAVELIDMEDELNLIAFEAKISEIQQAAAEKIHSSKMLVKLACEHPSIKIRQSAAEKIETQETLQQVCQIAKGKDKTIWRIVQEKLDAIKQAQEEATHQSNKAQKICSDLEKLSQQTPEPLLKQKIELLQQQWQEIAAEPKELLQETFETQSLAAEKVLEAYEVQQKALQAEHIKLQHSKTHKAKDQQTDDDEDPLLSLEDAEFEQQQAVVFLEEALSILKSTPVDAIDIPSLRATLTTQKARWQYAVEVHTPSTEISSHFNTKSKELDAAIDAVYKLRTHSQAITELNETLSTTESDHVAKNENLYHQAKHIVSSIHWPANVREPVNLKTLNKDFALLEERFRRQEDITQALEQSIETHFQNFEQALEEGKIKECQTAKKQLTQLINKLTLNRANMFRKKLKPLQAQLNELMDWQAFAAQPKKEALVNSMEGLADDPNQQMDPMVRFEYIQRLQNEWKSLGQLPKPEEQKLWNRFQTAATQAFKPCKDYFEAQANQKELQKQHKENICLQLKSYLEKYNWAQAYWPDVQKTIKVAKDEWRQLPEIDRKSNKLLDDQFYSIIQQLEEKLDAYKESNLQLKTHILEKAQVLLEENDIEQAFRSMRALREEWKKIGLLPREHFKSMNQSFQAIGDQLATKKQKLWSDVNAQKKHNAQEIQKELEDFSKTIRSKNAEALLSYHKEPDHLDELFKEYEPLHDKDRKKLYQQAQELKTEFLDQQAEAQLLQATQELETLLSRGKILRDLESKLLESTLHSKDLIDYKADWNRIQELNTEASTRLNTRFDAVMQAFDTQSIDQLQHNLARAEQKAHELCVLMEILAQTDSPDEDQAFRMQLQVNRLNHSLTNKNTIETPLYLDEFQQLELEWYLTGPISKTQNTVLLARIEKARQAYREEDYGKNS